MDDAIQYGPALLFCPADRPDRYAKALATADCVVLDLEDAVAASRKESARAALLATPLDPQRVIVRVNASDTAAHVADLASLRTSNYRTIMVPKCESPDALKSLTNWHIVALCETPLGVVNAAAIAAADSVVGLMWGAEDLCAAMGGRASRSADGSYLHYASYARSAVLVAAKAHRRRAIDAVYINMDDTEGLAQETSDAAVAGFDLKACIHPAQVPTVRQAFVPSRAETEWARRVIDAAGEEGAIRVDGRMIDAPLIRQAEQIYRAAFPDTAQSRAGQRS